MQRPLADKEQLFLSVIQEGAYAVAKTHIAIADRHFRKTAHSRSS